MGVNYYQFVSIRLIVMKESTCGRIVSQRKMQNSLLRQYDTKTTINIGRINELKQKYNKNQSRTPLKGLTPNITEFSEFANQIKVTQLATETNVMKQDVNMHINEYKRKATQTNNSINQKLNYIEEELNRWKLEKQAKQMKELKEFKQKQLLRQALSIKVSTSRNVQSSIRLPESMKVSQIENQNQPETSVVQRTLNAKLDAKLHNTKKIDESNCKLLGEFKKQRVISKQFTIFINRLKDQISLDIDFTQIMLSLPINDRHAVRQFIRRSYPTADVEFFIISPIEHDPLQAQAKVSYEGSIEGIGHKLHQFYVKIQEHYKLKLLRNFDLQTVDTLFQEIGVKQMTLGHLISYINMRTGKQFRNRALVKLLRRLDICSHIIDRRQFTKGFVKL